MKRALSLILALVMCLGLCACGGDMPFEEHDSESNKNTPSKEELLDSASEFLSIDYLQEFRDNPVRAEQTYVGKIIKFVGRIEGITANNIKVIPMNTDYEYSEDCNITVNLATDEITSLSKGDNVAIVGKISTLPIALDVAYSYPVGEYIASQLDHMIEIFGNDDNGNGVLEKSDGSRGFFCAYKEDFTLLTGAEIKSALIGSWDVRDEFDNEFVYKFNVDGTSTSTLNNGDDCHWLVEDDFIYWGSTSGKINTERNTRMEVRKINDNTLIFYENDTGSYNGMTYSMNNPYAIFVKK